MGLLCAKLRHCCCCSCFLCISSQSQSSSSSSEPEEFQVLILGPAASGKTELGHRLSGLQRPEDDQEATNGVRCYSTSFPWENLPRSTVQLQLTEVGGNPEMQRLWRHYYASSHALIYCFDLSTDPEHLQDTFNLLAASLKGTQLTGKPVLLAASRYRDGVQLYDVEYAFGLEQLASTCNSPLLMCHMDEAGDLQRGIHWLCRQLLARKMQLERRIRYDVNMQVWQRRKRLLLSSGKLAQVHRQRFRRRNRKLWPATVQGFNESTARPSTAPPTIFFVRSPQVENSKNN